MCKLEDFDTCAHENVCQNVFWIIHGSPMLKTLAITNCAYVPSAAPLPESLNLKVLEFSDVVYHGLMPVFQLLEGCPNLEHLCLRQSEWDADVSPPRCMVDRMRTVELKRHREEGSAAFALAEYVLQHANRLKKLLITCVEDMPQQDVVRMRKGLTEGSIESM
ncbi:uncharacterized protein LOC110940902 [Helianthus annuus]|uniref:uncharacterized protein LOC110940902 n=1 Tax=Helianthus annuus TaxID=4232 RepID=UPI000B8F09AA|nr:uncharacterized protein LOC110940902 [Helianthus annuus]